VDAAPETTSMAAQPEVEIPEAFVGEASVAEAADVAPEPEVEAVFAFEPEPESEVQAAPDAAALAAERTIDPVRRGLLTRLGSARRRESVDPEVTAEQRLRERLVAEPVAAPPVEPVVAPPPAPVVQTPPVAAQPWVPEPTAPSPPPRPMPDGMWWIVAPESGRDDIAQPVWNAPRSPSVAPGAPSSARTEPSSIRAWSLSAPDPVPRPASPSAVLACRNCTLPLSASAKFCRRCGTPQG
jgi:hypothetical protein